MSDFFDDIIGEIEESGRSHSRYAPSSLKRILACPRSVALSETLQGAGSGASVYAAEGTVAHEVAEAFLRGQTNRLYQGGGDVSVGDKKTVDGHEIVIDADMHTHGQEYRDYIRALMVPGDTLYVELTVRLDGIVGAAANMYGHCDAAIWSPSRRLLIICDYKYGRGIKVSAIANEQLMAYALGALLTIPDLDPDDVLYVQTHVFQPRVPGQTPPELFAAVDLLRWGYEELAPIIAEIEKDGAASRPLVTGDHCRFCPFLHQCGAQRKRANDAVKKAFGAAPLPTGWDEQELADALTEARQTEAWASAVQKEALKRALQGKHIPDNKLVATRGKRVWKDEKVAVAVLENDFGLRAPDVYEQKFKSVAQIEKLIASNEFAEEGFKDLYETKSSGQTLVPASDPRPPVRVTGVKEAFRDAPINQEQE